MGLKGVTLAAGVLIALFAILLLRYMLWRGATTPSRPSSRAAQRGSGVGSLPGSAASGYIRVSGWFPLGARV